MTDYAGWKYGGVQYPLTGATGASLLRDADPSLYYILDFYTSMLALHLGTRIAAQASIAGAPIASAVAMYIGYDPSPYLTQGYFKFPLLAVYRKKEKMVEKSKVWRDDQADLDVMYILPPLSAAEAEQMMPILRTVGRVLDLSTEQGWYPTYAPPAGATGALVWGPDHANLEKIEITEGTYGAWEHVNDEVFFSWRGNISMTERGSKVTTGIGALGAFSGATGALDLADEDGTTVINIAQILTQSAPTLTGATGATGPAAGGTSITLTGTLFKTPAAVTIGNVPAINVVVVSPTTITCTTGEHLNPGLVDIVVTNLLDGQSGTLSDGFTYT